MNATWTQRWSAIVDRIRVLQTADDEEALLGELACARACRVVAFVNAHAMNGAASSAAFCEAIAHADLLLRDGSGMAILYRALGADPGRNMNGTDFIPRLIQAYRGRGVAFWGTREPYAARAAAHCAREFGVRPVSVAGGFEDAGFYVREAWRARPQLIVLGMGMPRQEHLARELRAQVPGAGVIVCGGAILDFLGGKVDRAPAWLRGAGMEWTYRLYREPRRLFQRYVMGNPAFLVKLAAWRFSRGSLRG